MKFYVLTAVLLLCYTTLNAQGFTLSGTVVDRIDKNPVIGANISVSHLDKTVHYQTGSQGKFSVYSLSPSRYAIAISYLGYQTLNDTILIDKNISDRIYNLVPSSTSLNEIVVTGTGTEHYLRDAPVQTEVISGKALKDYAGRSIEDILGGLSSSLTFSQNDMGSNLQLNGLKNDYILILLDGRRINGDVGGQNDLNRINMNNIDRIEIVKGAASSLYGSDAIGGVINFISKKDKDKFSITNTTRVGEYGDINESNNIIWNRDKWSSSTSFVLKHTDGWRNTNEEWHRSKLIENSVTKTVNRSTNYTLSQNLIYKVSKQLQFNADVSFYEKWVYRPVGEPLWRLNDFYYRNQTYGTGAKYNLPNKNTITADVSFDRYDYFYDYTGREYTNYFDENQDRIVYYPGDRIIQSSQRRWMVNLKGIFYLGDKNTLNVGTEDIYEKLVAPYRLESNKASTYSSSRYIQNEWNPTSKFNVTGGVRLIVTKEFGYSISPKISTMYKLGSFNLRGTYSNGYKTPTVKELYYHYYSSIMGKYKAYYGNKDLKPQKSNYYAINVEYIVPSFTMNVTFYHNNIRDMISLQRSDTSYEDKLLLVEETMKYVNLAKAHTYGIDVTFEAKLPYSIRIGGGYSFLNAKAQRTDDEDAKDYMQYVNINGTSHHNVSVNTSWSHSWKKYKLGLNVNGRYQSERYYTSDGNTKGYQLWRFNTSHSLLNKNKIKLDMNVGVDNIFNYIDRTPFGRNRGTNSPGRNYYVSVTMKFQNKNK